MTVLKVEGDLKVKQGVTVTSVSGNLGGPKGLLIYCTGTIQNEGKVTMTEKGAYAEGQNIFLFKNSNNTYEFIPSSGGSGGVGASSQLKGEFLGEAGGIGQNRRHRRRKWWWSK